MSTEDEGYWIGRNFGFLQDRINELEVENERLRNALKQIANLMGGEVCGPTIAKEALENK